MGQEGDSQSTLVLVAPMPRRPIALVARRQPNHAARTQSSRSQLSSTFSSQQTATALPLAPNSTQSANVEQTSSRSHPYSRSKTPVTAANGGLSSFSVHRSGVTSPVQVMHARRRSSVRDMDAIDSHAQLPAAIKALSMSTTITDEPMSSDAGLKKETQSVSLAQPMITSPVQRPADSLLTAAERATLDVDRTPTKRALKEMATQLSTQDSVVSPSLRPAAVIDELLPLSPTSSISQKVLPIPQSPLTLGDTLSALGNTASATPSPSLSDSHSRDPSCSPSPCPSPSHESNQGLMSPLSTPDWDAADDSSYTSLEPKEVIPLLLSQRRKLGLPLPMPTSPIPRKMTQNPFERSLFLHRPPQCLQQQFAQAKTSPTSSEDEMMADEAA